MDQAAADATELFRRVSPFLHPSTSSLSFDCPAPSSFSRNYGFPSLPPKPAKKNPVGLAEHLQKGHSELAHNLAPSVYTVSTLDTATDDSLNTSIFEARQRDREIKALDQQSEPGVGKTSCVSFLLDMEEGRSKEMRIGVTTDEETGDTSDHLMELPHFTSGWSPKARLMAMNPLKSLEDNDTFLSDFNNMKSDSQDDRSSERSMVNETRHLFGSSRSFVSNMSMDTGHISKEEYTLIEESLKKNFMFKNVSRCALRALVLTFERTAPMTGEIIVRQGDTCENGYVYVIAEGLCSVLVDGKPVPGPYGTLAPKSIFGETGVVNNTRRAATIVVKSDTSVIFRAHGKDFVNALNSNTTMERSQRGGRNPNDLATIDDAIDQLCGSKTLHGGDIIRQYQPGRLWLWSQWNGTILQHNIRVTLMAMLFSLLFSIIVRAFAAPTWELGLAPDEDHPLIQRLIMIRKIWLWQTTLCTFVLTFFVNQAYGHFTKMIGLTRSIQGRVNDFMLILATSVYRENGKFTPTAEVLMDDVSASVRLFHAFFWASQAERFKCLATPLGVDRMVQRGIMTPKQAEVLQKINTAEGHKFIACMEWMMIRCWQGIDEKVIRPHIARDLVKMMYQLRDAAAIVKDDYKSRMPLAYTHFVQVMVDSFLLLSPFALYADLGVYSILCVGMITLFYTGLLDLAKIFLDPLDNQAYTESSVNLGVDLGVLTRETNASSVHFKESGSRLPFDFEESKRAF